MQREIKFRAWDGKRMFVPDGLKNPVNFTSNLQHIQFTGLKDKDGREIYEGDIVRGSGLKKVKDGVNLWEVFGNLSRLSV